jgi:hypothetical protein
MQREMLDRNVFFTLASDGQNKLGLRPTTDKFSRFNVVVPLFKMHKIWFPHDLKNSQPMKEAVEELSLASVNGFRSKHDDFIDTISMLAQMKAWKPSQVAPKADVDKTRYWLDEVREPEDKILDRYVV